MKLLKYVQQLSELTKSTSDKQRNLNVSEVFHLWNHLIQRYNVIYITDTLEGFTRDDDLRLILKIGRDVLGNHVKILEDEMLSYGIPLPTRPPKQAQATSNLEIITDRFTYRRVLRGIQSFLSTHIHAFIHSTSPKIREIFMTFMVEEMKLYDKFLEYGKLKGYELKPPVYKIQG